MEKQTDREYETEGGQEKQKDEKVNKAPKQKEG